MAIPELIRDLGADPEAVLSEVGIDPAVFRDGEQRMPLAVRNHIIKHCAERTGCPHFGLLVGERAGLHTFGLLGLLMKHAPDVKSALQILIRHLRVHILGASVTLVRDGDHAMLVWRMHEPGVEAVDHVGDGTVAALHVAMRELCGPDWRPTEARFAHRMPADVGPYRQFFRIALRFDAEDYALVFPARYLGRRLPAVDADVRRMLEAQIDQIERRHPDDFAEQVRSVVRSALMAGRAKSDHVAALFGMHVRTLNRRLGDCGVGFQQLVDECRFEVARQLLEDSDKSAIEIAELLGYAAPGAFTRAFQRWSGATPSSWRATRKAAARYGAPSIK